MNSLIALLPLLLGSHGSPGPESEQLLHHEPRLLSELDAQAQNGGLRQELTGPTLDRLALPLTLTELPHLKPFELDHHTLELARS